MSGEPGDTPPDRIDHNPRTATPEPFLSTEATARRLDHLVHAVPDLDRAAEAYRDLGFVVTPRADHPFGTSNRLIVLDRSYVELVSVTRPQLITGGFADQIRRRLERGPGLCFLVLGSDYAAADHAALHRTGLAVGDVLTFSRSAPLPDGSETEASFSLVYTPGFPDLGLFLCQHHTPEAVWVPGFQDHPNRAQRVAVTRGEGSPGQDSLLRLQAILGTTAAKRDQAVVLPLDGSELHLMPADHTPVLTGFTVTAGRTDGATIDGVEVELVS